MPWAVILIVLAFCLGLVIGVLVSLYLRKNARYSGTINILKGEHRTLFSLELNSEPEELENMKEVRFKVQNGSSQE